MRILCAMPSMVALLTVTAPQSAGQVLPGPHGPVEFIGLQRWDAQELFDAIQALEPDRPFHACAAVMEEKLGFADAAAFLYFSGDVDSIDQSSNRYTVVVGIEDSAQVQYRPPGNATVDLPQTWKDLEAVVGGDRNMLTVATRLFRSQRFAHEFAEIMGADPDKLDQVWDLISRADGSEDLRLAHEVLAKEASWSKRAIATLILGNFIDDDTSWLGLVSALIDSNARVTGVAHGMLYAMKERKRDPVEWSAARSPLLALFGGTNPWAFSETLEVLVATNIDPEFGQMLARERPDLLLAYVGAEHVDTREPAIAFLNAVSGEDYGTDLEAWTAWISSERD